MKSAIGFKPYLGNIAVAIPADVIGVTQAVNDKGIQLQEHTIKKNREEYIKSGNPLIVAAVADDVEHVEVEDKVLIASHGQLQQIEVGDEEKSVYFVVRQSAVLGFID